MCHLKGYKYSRSAYWSALLITNTCVFLALTFSEEMENTVCSVQLVALVYKLLSAVFAGKHTKALINILSKAQSVTK